MVKQRKDADDLPCDTANATNAYSENQPASAQAMQQAHDAIDGDGAIDHQHIGPRHINDAGVEPGRAESAPGSAREERREETPQTDVAGLYSSFNAYANSLPYHEFVQEEDARNAACRWPLINESQNAGTHDDNERPC